ncbi:hypothetical protein [Pedobacter rhodius]|uniref:Uncharacterized protein n=1 Tax=Pedobacter rhodius TaxID=3004098 RepID=A0ABT4KZL1_9SPHI|nr:hypothetical protein [Pedobacter sp. SJ11]MCZ4224161.1 hypothetical protein [Pedobacter sp. SJ11]
MSKFKASIRQDKVRPALTGSNVAIYERFESLAAVPKPDRNEHVVLALSANHGVKWIAGLQAARNHCHSFPEKPNSFR